MSDPFAAYAKQANTIVSRPPPLLGLIKLRADARLRYSEIVADLEVCLSLDGLESYLESIRAELIQFAAELPFLWTGDDTFRGLEKEIEWARARFDDGLDFPRWEPDSMAEPHPEPAIQTKKKDQDDE